MCRAVLIPFRFPPLPSPPSLSSPLARRARIVSPLQVWFGMNRVVLLVGFSGGPDSQPLNTFMATAHATGPGLGRGTRARASGNWNVGGRAGGRRMVSGHARPLITGFPGKERTERRARGQAWLAARSEDGETAGTRGHRPGLKTKLWENTRSGLSGFGLMASGDGAGDGGQQSRIPSQCRSPPLTTTTTTVAQVEAYSRE